MERFDTDEPPPPYSPGPGRDAFSQSSDLPSHQTHNADANHTFACIETNIASARHAHSIHRHGSNRFTIERSASARSDLGSPLEGQTININSTTYYTSIYSNKKRLATAKFLEGRPDFIETYIGPAYNSSTDGWRSIKFTRGNLLHPTSYEFEAGSRHLAWKHHHGPHLLGSTGNWTLEDVSAIGLIAPSHREHQSRKKIITGGQSMATYRANPGSWVPGHSLEYTVGEVRWKDEHGEEVEIMALLLLVVILQQL